jgi:K+-transporting ATPase ATPase A chain
MNWKLYASSFVVFGLVGTVVTFLILRLQFLLPLFQSTAPHLTTTMTSDLTLNTAISFATTTTWQAY